MNVSDGHFSGPIHATTGKHLLNAEGCRYYYCLHVAHTRLATAVLHELQTPTAASPGLAAGDA
jgi:hypothetical protein